MIERILVPVDGSELAGAAIPFAELIPSRRVRLLIVEPVTLPAAGQHGVREAPPPWEKDTSSPAAYLDAVAAPFRRQGREVEPVVTGGNPADQIVAAAADAELIVMATRGRGAGGRALFGSVAADVAGRAPVPTLLVRGTDTGVIAAVARIVVPLDGSLVAESALPFAVTMSRTLGVRLHLVRVIDASLKSATAASLEQEGVSYLEQQAVLLRSYDVLVTTEVLRGPVGRTLVEAIGRFDLVVMTTRGRSGVRRALIGSVAEQLVREAAAPVVLVQRNTPGAGTVG